MIKQELVNRLDMVHFKNIEDKFNSLTEVDCENPTEENGEIMFEYLKLSERYAKMGISTDGYMRHFGLI